MRYQRTLPLPPKTTLSGLLCAALGLDASEANELTSKLKIGIVEIQREGIARDLWRITKLKQGAGAEFQVLVRERIVHPLYVVYFSGYDESCLESWKTALQNPKFALTLGASDDLCIIRNAQIVNLTACTGTTTFQNTLLPFNYKDKGVKMAKLEIKSGSVIHMPQIFSVPTGFALHGARRTGINIRDFTYVSTPGVEVSNLEGAWSDGGRSFFLF